MAVVDELIGRIGFEVSGQDKLKSAENALKWTKNNVKGLAGSLKGLDVSGTRGFDEPFAQFHACVHFGPSSYNERFSRYGARVN